MSFASSRKALAAASAMVLAVIAAAAHAATITVNSVSDALDASDGLCTLREAIAAANTNAPSGGTAGECAAGDATPTTDAIVFAIPGAGVRTIAPTSALPAIAEPVTIDGYTQPGATPNTLATGASNAVLRVEIDGTNAGSGAALLRFTTASAGSEVRGVVVNRAQASAFRLDAPVRIAGSFIGTDAAGAAPLPNASHGIEITGPGPGVIGGTAPAERNVIAFNGGAGVRVDATATLWRIVGNSIQSNADKGIALAPGPLPLANDVLDADTGANGRQNFPLLDVVTVTATSVRLQGRIESAPSRTLVLDVYGSAPPARPADFLQGEAYLGSAPSTITTDAQGRAPFDVTLPVAGHANLTVTATLTDVTGCFSPACGSTSEFAQRGVFSVAPRWGAAGSALPLTVRGHLFQPGALFALGGTAALAIAVVDDQTLTGLLPPLQPGTLYDVTVSNPDATTATMPRAFVTDFLDVAPGSPFYPFVMGIAAGGITSGCLPGEFCGGNAVSRAQMAVFLVRGLYGPFYAVPPAQGIFADVPPGSFAAEWIEQFFTEGITSGCATNPLRFCPAEGVTRGQMAVFLLRTKHGPGFTPPPCTGLFDDVACTGPSRNPFVDWIEQLFREGITTGCANSPLRYCPGGPVLRLQMAVFLTRVFGLADGPNAAPAVNAGSDQSIVLPAVASLVGSATDDGLPNPPASLTFAWSKQSGPGAVTFGTPADVATTASFSQAGVYVLRLTVSDGELSASDDVQVTVGAAPLNQPPQVNAGPDQTITLPASASLSGSASDDGLPNPPGAITIAWSKVSGPGTVTFGNAAVAVTTASFSAAGVYVLRLSVTDGGATTNDELQVTVQPAGSPPALNPPPIDPSVPTNTPEATAFLYTGPSPVQTGVAPGTIELARAGVIRGKVMTRDGAPLPSAVVTIVGHPQFGQTRSRANGEFDLAVNGGTQLTVSFDAPGFLTVHRPVFVPWQDFAIVPDVAMIALDPAVTTIALNAPAIQVHASSIQTDASGSRRAVLMVPAGTTATMALPGGGTQPLASMNVRATEYTVGPNGLAAMPAPLPRDSAYTYAAEFSVDEAMAAGATRVDFSQPVAIYIDNFLGFPVGGVVPLGAYDRVRATWIPEPNGRVIQITGVTGGLADVDTVGATSHPPLVLDAAERQQLAVRYPVGTSLWRVAITHFTPLDPNWPFGPPPDAVPPRVPPPFAEPDVDQCADAVAGSLIECQSQALRQFVPVAGTGRALAYSSMTVPGRTAPNRLVIPVSGAGPLPVTLKRIDVRLNVAGRSFVLTAPALPNQQVVFDWDGLDAYGRQVQGSQPVKGTVGYVYDFAYTCAEWNFAFPTFGRPCPGTLGIPARAETAMESEFRAIIGAVDARGLGLGGWTLTGHHVYDPVGLKLHTGDGGRRGATSGSGAIDTIAGGGALDPNPGTAAVNARLTQPAAVLVGPDGTVYFGNSTSNAGLNTQILHITPEGLLGVTAGLATGSGSFAGDGLPATQTSLTVQGRMAFAPDGTLHFIDPNNGRVRRIGQDGRVSTVAGAGNSGSNADGIPATQASLTVNGGIAFAPDGTLYLTDRLRHRVRRVGTDGIITTVAGNGTQGFGGDGGLATQARLSFPTDVALAPDGSLLIADSNNQRIRRVGPDGIISTFAGTGNFVFNGDGLPAAQTNFNGLHSIVFAPDGSLFVKDATRVRRIDAAGIARTVVGTGDQPFNGDNIPAAAANFLSSVGSMSFDSSGTLYMSVDNVQERIRRVRLPLPGFDDDDIAIPSEDGRELYQFDRSGRHLSTRDTLTGGVLHQFTYDAAGRLATLVEKTGGIDNVTTIQRDASGQPTGIVSPYGQVTALAVDGNGFLAQIASPLGETVQVASTAEGLMQSMTLPRGGVSQYAYDSLGRLVQATDPRGGVQTFVRTALANGHRVTRTSPLGRATLHTVENLGNGDTRLTTTHPGGESTVLVLKPNGVGVHTRPDGTVVTTTQRPDPRFGMLAPITARVETRAPSGLTKTSVTTLTASLATPGNPLSLTQLARTTTTNGQAATSVYTAATRTTVTTSPTGRTTTTVLDTLGRIVSRQRAGLEAATFAYDARGRLGTVTLGSGPGARITQFAYDALGNLASVTDALGRTTAFSVDVAGRLVSRTRPDGSVVAYAYDADGNLTGVTPPGKPQHVLSYSSKGELTGMTPPALPGTGPTTFVVDADGLVGSIDEPGNQDVLVTFGADGRPASRAFTTSGVVTGTDTLARDAAGRVTALTAASGATLSFTYDGALVTGESAGGTAAGSFARTFDAFFRPASESVNGGPAVTFAYDADQLLVAAGPMTITRNAQNGLATATSLGVVTTSLGYDGFSDVTSFSASASGAPLYAAALVRDALGRIVQKTETIGGTTDTFVYGYDTVGQLVSVTRNGAAVESYAYDGNGNRTSATVQGATQAGTYDAQDRLVGYGPATFAYTPAGRLASRTAGGQTTSYQYDQVGNLRAVTLPDGTSVTYDHDGSDRRIGKRVNGALVQRFVYGRALRPSAELDAAGNLVSRFVYAGGRVPAYMERAGVRYQLVTDTVGSVRLVVDTATGAVAQRLDYDTFGNVTADTNPGFQPFGFAGGLYDPQTGLVRFGARDYDALTGRWTAKDPIGFGGGDENLYRYVRNDPLNRVDPTGLITPEEMAYLREMIESVEGKIRRYAEQLAGGGNLTPAEDGDLTQSRQLRDWAKKELKAARAADNARNGGGYGRLNAGGVLGKCIAALGALDVVRMAIEADENDRTLLEQAEVEEQQMIDAGVDTIVKCLGPVCLVEEIY